jgi:DNA-binding transcriptional LysR family regulator
MDLNRAAVFVRVVDEGGFTAAARALRLPKSSVSRSVALLEEELGARLLQRSTRRLRLTEAGSAFYERASRGLAGVQEAAAAVADLQGLLRGPIKITAPVDAGVWLLSPLVARFVGEHPGVHIELVLTTRMVDLVAEGFDFALRAGVLADSLNHDCVMFRPDRGRARWKLTGPDGEQTLEVRGPVGADDFTFLQRMVAAGSGIGLLPGFLCQAGVGRGELVRVLPDYTWAAGDFHLVYPSARYLPQRAAAFRDFLLQELGEPQGRV